MSNSDSSNSFKIFWKYFKCADCNYAFAYDQPQVCPSCKSYKVDTMLECGSHENKITFCSFDAEE